MNMRSYLSDNDDDDDDDNDSDYYNNNKSKNIKSARMRSWLDWKEEGKRAYERGDYSHALDCYRTAVRPEYECPTKADQAVLWSNIVACRLQLCEEEKDNAEKKVAMARAAVEDAKQCTMLNPNWSKGYLRLASAYIALGAGHSNDACNALQSALRIDPGNAQARQMLVRELRRDHAHAHAAAAAGTTTPSATTTFSSSFASSTASSSRGSFTGASAPPAEMDEPPTFSSSSSPPSIPLRDPPSSNPSYLFNSASSNHRPSGGGTTTSTNTVDDGLTWRERFYFQWIRVVSWYHNLNPDVKTLLKLGLLVLCLYIAFGGRFGLERPLPPPVSRPGYTTMHDDNYKKTRHYHKPTTTTNTQTETTTKGKYGWDNVYEQYYRLKERGTYHHRHQQQHHDDYYDNSFHYSAPPPLRRSSSSHFSVSSLFDGSPLSMLVLVGIAYIAHRNGINPFQAILMLNLIGGGGRRRGGIYHYGGFYGGGPQAFGAQPRGFRW